MKLRRILACLLALLLLTACAPVVENDTELQVEPSATVTPDAPTPTPEVTPEPADYEESVSYPFVVEGVEETIECRKHISTMGYSMVYDHNLLQFEKGEQSDVYKVKNPVESLPPVQIVITKSNSSVEQVVETWEKSGAKAVGYLKLDGCETRVLHYAESQAPDGKIIAIYVVQVGSDVYTIEDHYFMEAAEGWGVRTMEMIYTIAFADAPEAKELKVMFRNKEMKDFSSVIGDVTELRAGADFGAACRDVVWTSSDESVCKVVYYEGLCFVEITGEGVATVTATCGDLSASTVVRGKKSW